MPQQKITIGVESEKYSALCTFLLAKGLEPEAEIQGKLEERFDTLYEKTVPTPNKEYIKKLLSQG